MGDSKSLYPQDTCFPAQESHTHGSHFYLRDDVIDIEKTLDIIRNQGHIHLRYIHIYCDTLTCSPTSSLNLYLPQYVRSLTIFARDFLATVNGLREIKIFQLGGGTVSPITFYYGEINSDIVISDSTKSRSIALGHALSTCSEIQAGAQSSHDHSVEALPGVVAPSKLLDNLLLSSTIDAQTIEAFSEEASKHSNLSAVVNPAVIVGKRMRYDSGTAAGFSVESLVEVPHQELEGPSMAEIQQFAPGIWATDSLSRLIHRMFLLVSENILAPSRQVPRLISQLKFIINCSRSSQRHASMFADAHSLLERLELPAKFPGMISNSSYQYYAPKLNPTSALLLLEGKMKEASEIDQRLESWKRHEDLKSLIQQNHGIVLTNLGENVSNFRDTKDIKKSIELAIQYCEDKRVDMSSYVESTRNANNVFQLGIEYYKKQKQKEFEIEMWKLGGELLVTVGIAVVTSGAGAPLTVNKLAEAQRVMREGVKMIDSIKLALEKILKALGKLLPKLAAASNKQKSILSVSQNAIRGQGDMEKRGQMIVEKSMVKDMTVAIDYLDILADWDEFDISVDEMFSCLKSELGQDSINGMSEYKIALKSQAVRGRVLIDAMRQLQEYVQRGYREGKETDARKKRREELFELAAQVEAGRCKEKFAQDALNFSLSQDSLEVRRNLFVRFHYCLLSLIYHTNDPEWAMGLIEELSIRSEISKFREVLDKMQRIDKMANSKLSQAQLPLRISTASKGRYFAPDWHERLSRQGVIEFDIPWDHPAMYDAHTIRLEEVEADFIGHKVTSSISEWWPRCVWYFGPQFVDRNFEAKPIQYYLPDQHVGQDLGQKGKWKANSDASYPTPFCRGRIVFTAISGRPQDSNEFGVDFSGVSEVVLKIFHTKKQIVQNGRRPTAELSTKRSIE